MKTNKRIVFLVMIGVLIGGIGLLWWSISRNHGAEGTFTLTRKLKKLPIWGIINRKAPEDALILYGNMDIRQVNLAFDARGRIASMKVIEGQQVQEGQLLVILDKRALELAVRRARGDLEKSRADLKLSEIEYRRILKIRKQDAGAASQRDEDVLREKRDAARALVEMNKADLALAKKELSDAFLHAPANAIVQNRILEPGDMASPDRPVYTLALIDPMWARVYVDEPDLGRIHEGMRAHVSTDSYPGKRYSGWVGFISPTAEFTPKTVETPQLRTDLVYQARVYVCNPQNELRLGMPVTVHIPFKQAGEPLTKETACP